MDWHVAGWSPPNPRRRVAHGGVLLSTRNVEPQPRYCTTAVAPAGFWALAEVCRGVQNGRALHEERLRLRRCAYVLRRTLRDWCILVREYLDHDPPRAAHPQTGDPARPRP